MQAAASTSADAPASNAPPTRRERYLRRFLAYALPYKLLLATCITMGLVKFGLMYGFPWLIGTATDLLANAGAYVDADRDDKLRVMTWLVVAGIGLTVLSVLTTYGRGFFTQMLGVRLIRDIRQDLFGHLHRLSLQFYSRERSGSVASRLLGDISNASQLVNNGVITLAMDMFSLVLGLGLLVALDWRLTVAALVTLPLYALTFKYLNPKVRRASRLVASSFSRISGNVQEQLAGIALVKVYAAEERERRAFEEDTEQHYMRNVDQGRVSHLVGAISEGLINLNTVIVVGFGGYLVLASDLSPGSLVTFIGYLNVMYTPVRRFAEINVVFQTSMASIERVFQVFDITPAITDDPNARRDPPAVGEVEFDDVRFSYHAVTDEARGLPETGKRSDLRGDRDFDRRRQKRRERVEVGRGKQRRRGRDVVTARKVMQMQRVHAGDGLSRRWVLDGLTFTVSPGERVALVGPSGAGKTTLVSLLPRLYDIDEGAIRIDGLDIRGYELTALRRGIGIVQQDSFLFSGTIRQNIRYGRPQAGDEEIVAAARAANAHDFITTLPDGYDSVVGERGVALSGGQRQRISISRAILKDPRILILDEATSALDTESEVLVQQALENLMTDRTSIIIAHRLSTVRNADRILVMEAGRVVESGPHDELVAKGGLYARLVRQQFGPDASVLEDQLGR